MMAKPCKFFYADCYHNGNERRRDKVRNHGEGAVAEKITLTAEEVSQIMGMSKRFVYELAKRGELPCKRFGKKVLFSRVAIERLMEETAEDNV